MVLQNVARLTGHIQTKIKDTKSVVSIFKNQNVRSVPRTPYGASGVKQHQVLEFIFVDLVLN